MNEALMMEEQQVRLTLQKIRLGRNPAFIWLSCRKDLYRFVEFFLPTLLPTGRNVVAPLLKPTPG